MRTRIALVLGLTVCLLTQGVSAQTSLSVISAGPTGEIANLTQAAEIRVRFSEPMVTIGRIPDEVAAPFFSIRPAVRGSFRWAGPTILVFTPDSKTPLPRATRYEITIDRIATAVSGRKLEEPYRFGFTTPTVRLLRTDWHRQNGRYDQPIIVALRFNQPVRPADVAAHIALRYQGHAFRRPSLTAEERARMGASAAQFDAKVVSAAATASSNAAMPVSITPDWDKKRFPPSSDLVVLRTTEVPATDGWLALEIDNRLPAIEGRETSPTAQTHTLVLDRTFFIDEFDCSRQCDADAYNVARPRSTVDVERLRRAASIRDITDRTREQDVTRPANTRQTRRSRVEQAYVFGVEDLGFDRQPPAHTYAISIDGALQAIDGQTLGYTWTGIVENWHERAFTSFGDGHGVWETGGGALPFYARNFADMWQWAAPIQPDRLMPTVRDLQRKGFQTAPSTESIRRTLRVTPDTIQSYGLDLSRALSPAGTGLVWTAVKRGTPIARSRPFGGDNDTTASVVQVTNLGISVKDSPQNTLVFVTRLDTGAPVADADVSIVRLDNSIFWKGRTDQNGIALAPETRIRDPRKQYELSFIVTAAKDGDLAYVGSDWNEGIAPWMFGNGYDLSEASALLRGSVFTDRGVYKLGEEVHVKGVLRNDSPAGIQLIEAGTPLYTAVHDSRGKLVASRTVTINQWSSTEWTFRVPTDGALGQYEILASLDKAALEQNRPARRPEEEEEDANWEAPWRKVTRGGFLVAAYRRPDFRVDATLSGDPAIAGAPLKAAVTARYLFGAPMAKRPIAWTYVRTPLFAAPASVTAKFAADRFAFVGCCEENARPSEDQIASRSAALDSNGQLTLDLETRPGNGFPYQYTFEGDVEDVSRQHIAGRSSFVVHPASFYIGLQRPPLFVAEKDGLKTSVVAVSTTGNPVPGVVVDVALTEVQWHSVRRAEGNGFYTWETEKKEVDAGHFTITTRDDPAPLSIPLPAGGSFTVRASARDADGLVATTRMSFYAIGSGYTAWQRYDHNRIDLVPERESYKPGDTARIMIQSPWERATALLTVEREGIRSHKAFTLTSTQQTIDVPITAADIPNVFVSVLLIKGRTRSEAEPGAGEAASGATSSSASGFSRRSLFADTSDPGKPAFRLGYTRLQVGDASKRLSLTVKTNKDEFRPAGTATVDVQVVDGRGMPAPSEITLWAVDYGVLSLTGFRVPDVVDSVYVPKMLQVMTEDSRQRIVSRRVLTPKGSDSGGGGGVDSAVNQLRKDFRVLAFWIGSVATDSRGHASANVKLPESLTTYRIMAVGGDKESRFGSGQSEIRVNKPVVLKPAFPRFLARGDKAYFGSVVTSQLKEPGTAIVTMRSLDPGILDVAGESRHVVQIAPGGSSEVRFDVEARATGRARIQTTVRIGNESDAFEDVVPVEILVSPESVAAYGEVAPGGADTARMMDAKQTLTVPTGIVPGVGGLRLELASTALVGLGEGAQYVVEYPYGCAEQRASRAFVLALVADLGNAFQLPGIDPKDLRPRVQAALRELEKFQCPSGGFAFWPGECRTTSPYLTSYVLQVFQTAAALKYDVTASMMDRAYSYLERALAEPPPVNEGWWPMFTAWKSFAIKVLVDGGRNQDSNINRLYGYLDRMPVFAIAYLHDALLAKGERGPRVAELQRRLGNAILPEAGSAHIEELSDPYLLWFWNSNIRSTSIVLNSLVRAGDPGPEIPGLVRWLMAARTNGRWGNTQENALAMQALVAYYAKYESAPPHFTALVRLGAQELARQTFLGRSTQSVVRELPMLQLTAAAAPGSARELSFQRAGSGTLYYAARLTYAPDTASFLSRDNGFHIERRYAAAVNGPPESPSTTFNAGDLVRVTLSIDIPKERRFVAVTDPLPAGFEPVESWFATTAAELVKPEDAEDGATKWQEIWRRGTFDHVERHDDRVLLFATRLAEGHHEFSYVVRATTAGSFQIAPARVEQMYEPEISGRTSTQSIEVKR